MIDIYMWFSFFLFSIEQHVCHLSYWKRLFDFPYKRHHLCHFSLHVDWKEGIEHQCYRYTDKTIPKSLDIVGRGLTIVIKKVCVDIIYL